MSTGGYFTGFLAQGNYPQPTGTRPVRRDQEKNAEIEAIRAALIEGEQSGMSTRTPDDIRKAVQKRMQKNGQL